MGEKKRGRMEVKTEMKIPRAAIGRCCLFGADFYVLW